MPLLMCDLDDTLVVRAPLWRQCAQSVLAERGRPEQLEWFIETDRGGHFDRERFWAAVGERLDLSPVALRGFRAEFSRRYQDSYRIEPPARAALADAREAGWRIAVVSNGPTVGQSRKVHASGLDTLVDAVCISEEVGARKPEPRIFRTAAERAGTTLEGAWMIGDDIDADIAGAHAVGARSVQVRVEHQWVEHRSGAVPDHVADTVAAAVRHVLANG